MEDDCFLVTQVGFGGNVYAGHHAVFTANKNVNNDNYFFRLSLFSDALLPPRAHKPFQTNFHNS